RHGHRTRPVGIFRITQIPISSAGVAQLDDAIVPASSQNAVASESDMPQTTVPSRDSGSYLACRVSELKSSVMFSSVHHATIWRERYAIQIGPAFTKARLPFLDQASVPELHGSVAAGRCQAIGVGRKLNCKKFAGVSAQDVI